MSNQNFINCIHFNMYWKCIRIFISLKHIGITYHKRIKPLYCINYFNSDDNVNVQKCFIPRNQNLLNHKSRPHKLMQLIHSNRNEEVVVVKCSTQNDQALKDSSSTFISSGNASKMRSYNSLALSSSFISNQIYNDLVLVILLLRNSFKISWHV